MGLTDNDLWWIFIVFTLIVWAALSGNLYDPNSRTNDLDEILGLDLDLAIEKARADLKNRLKH